MAASAGEMGVSRPSLTSRKAASKNTGDGLDAPMRSEMKKQVKQSFMPASASRWSCCS